MKLADGVEMLEIGMGMGRSVTIHPMLLHENGHAVLVDAGMPGHGKAIEEAMRQAGISMEQLEAVVFTHQDIDHIGGIAEVLKQVGKPVDVYAHGEDRPYIEGEKTLIKMSEERVEQMLQRLPEEAREKAAAIFRNPPSAKITKVVSDGDIIPLAGGLEVIFTPGHTPGHISLYHRPSKTLITGDAAVSDNGKIFAPNPQVTLDMKQALESVKKFTNFDVEKIVCYHGGLCDKDANLQLQTLVAQA